MKYLVVKCEELNDGYECDANRIPVCITDDYSEYNKFGYEIYKVLENGKLKLIREYDQTTNEGFAVYYWKNTDDVEVIRVTNPTILENLSQKRREDFTKSLIQRLKKKYRFSGTVNDIFADIQSFGSYGDLIEDKWIVIGEYYDDNYSSGY